ncbi:uncharacterized protein LOC133297455 [Gastrolobium bilobum]|uniref:uncharacterized protein LOC133297455 n=1 Tax=Gastrolobium bilobum TaxID=150636 RepID=UPI002AAF7EAD|nr:uncharacterized protein LOC133297455 [Gastrolobium bilobum]
MGTSPFQVTYGRSPPCLLEYTLGSTTVDAVETDLLQRSVILATLKQNLEKAQAQMKSQADRKRKAITFSVGDQVLLRLQPFRQLSVHRRSSHKLSLRFYRPFEILERVASVAYCLQLPPGSRVHPVFHASLLRPFCSSGSYKIHDLAATTRSIPPSHVPAAIISQHTIWRNGWQVPQVLVQWEGLLQEDSTWEDTSLVVSDSLTKHSPLVTSNVAKDIEKLQPINVQPHSSDPTALPSNQNGDTRIFISSTQQHVLPAVPTSHQPQLFPTDVPDPSPKVTTSATDDMGLEVESSSNGEGNVGLTDDKPKRMRRRPTYLADYC